MIKQIIQQLFDMDTQACLLIGPALIEERIGTWLILLLNCLALKNRT